MCVCVCLHMCTLHLEICIHKEIPSFDMQIVETGILSAYIPMGWCSMCVCLATVVSYRQIISCGVSVDNYRVAWWRNLGTHIMDRVPWWIWCTALQLVCVGRPPQGGIYPPSSDMCGCRRSVWCVSKLFHFNFNYQHKYLLQVQCYKLGKKLIYLASMCLLDIP